jgi:site-specific DNA recombinase
MELKSLVVPIANAAEEAGRLIMNLPRLWSKANQEEKRKLLLTMLDAVYVDAKKTKSVVAIKPKPPFKPVFQVAASKKGSKIFILNEPVEGSFVFLVKTKKEPVALPPVFHPSIPISASGIEHSISKPR